MPEHDSTEIWKDVVGFEGIYFVSNLGRIRSRYRPWGTLKTNTNKFGYRSFHATKKGRETYPSVHATVAEAFIGPRPPGFQVNHKNGVTGDNRVENLEWVTPKQNTNHAIYVLGKTRSGQDHGRCKLNEDIVRRIRELRSRGKKYKEIADTFGIAIVTAWNIANRRLWKHIP